MRKNTSPTRICTICGEEKPATTEFFHLANGNTGQLRPMCKPCRSRKPVQQRRDKETLEALAHIPCPEGCKLIPLNGAKGVGKAAIVDDCDYEMAMRFRWYLTANGYAVSTLPQRKSLLMHRLILGEPEALVDHANRDKLDNRRTNLREATLAQNAANSKRRSTNKSGYKGVSWSRHDKRWVSEIKVGQKKYCLGYFRDVKEAAKAYDDAAIKHFGEFALTNF